MNDFLLNPRSLLLLICAFTSCSTTPESLVLKSDEYSELFPYVTQSVTPNSIVGMWSQRVDPNGAPGSGTALLFRKDGTLLNKTYLNVQYAKELGIVADEERFNQFAGDVNSQVMRNKYAYTGNGVWAVIIENRSISEDDAYMKFRLAKGKLLRETYARGTGHFFSVFDKIQ